MLFNDAVSCKCYIVSAINVRMSMERWWNDTDRWNRHISIKSCHNVALSTTYLTCTGLGSNLCLCTVKIVTNSLSQGMLDPFHCL